MHPSGSRPLDSVASGHADAEQAAALANEAKVAAAALAGAFQAAIAAADSEQEQLIEEEKVARHAATVATNERNQANDLAYLSPTRGRATAARRGHDRTRKGGRCRLGRYGFRPGVGGGAQPGQAWAPGRLGPG